MNKHLNPCLELLAQQAHYYAKYEYQYPEDLSENYGMIYEARFAQLIVKECSRVISGIPSCFDDYRNQIEVNMRDHCAETVMKYFGAEECLPPNT